MSTLRLRHHNDCPRCPVIGAEDIPGEEFFQLISLRFNVTIARKLSANHPSHRVEPLTLERWLEHARILESHIWHLPPNAGPGILVTLPAGCGRPLIDGNHRAARSLLRKEPFLAVVLNESETHELLRLSMHPSIAEHLWQRLASSKPHPAEGNYG